MKRFLILLFIGLCIATLSHAQSDTASVERPKIALVLSGGGARGAAHIGVIRLIEEMQIPIDIVTGTSMGAIVGALYAIGYTADEMDSLLMAQDWNMLLSNGVPRSMQPYALRKAEQQYQVNIPYTPKGRTEATTRYRDAGIKVQKHSLRGFPKVLTRPGLIDGQNLFNLFTELTIAYHDSIHYSTLPHPYACIATDLVTGEAVVLDKGFLAESMRASMSIPGVFFPIYKDGQVLVDGGVVNNYPVDVARAMGADIIIGVDLSSAITSSSALQTFPGIFERLIGTLGSDLRRRNVQNTDILIRPPVSRFPVMGFSTTLLSQLIDIGYQAAQENCEALMSIKQRSGLHADSASLQPKATELLTQPFSLANIVAPQEVRILLDEYGINEGSTVTAQTISEAITYIYGLGRYASVEYHLQGNTPYTLVVEVTPNPSSQVELGLRFDSEETAAALLRIGINRPRLTGPKFDLTTRIGINPRAEAHAAYAFGQFPQINGAIKYAYSDTDCLYSKREQSLIYHYSGADIYLSELLSHYSDLRLGGGYDYFFINQLTSSQPSQTNHYIVTQGKNTYFRFYASWVSDLFDAAYLPTSGYAYALNVAYHLKAPTPNDGGFFALQGQASVAIPLSNTTTLQPSAYLRWLFGKEIPIIYGNAMGGYLQERYMQQQLPFIGMLGCTFTQSKLTIMSIELRQQLRPDIYMTAIANYAHSSDQLKLSPHTPGIWGVAAGFTYNTTIGPLSLYAQWNDYTNRLGAYLSFGYDF